LGLTAVIELALAFSGSASLPMAGLLLVIAGALFALSWSKRATTLNWQI